MDECKESYLAAYKCYLQNKNSPEKCIKEFKEMNECKKRKRIPLRERIRESTERIRRKLADMFKAMRSK